MTVSIATSRRMQRVRRSGTEPELAMRKLLAAAGLRYRVHNRDLPGSPDVANRARRWVVFVHGCFWHAHEGCRRASIPRTNSSFWNAKRERNTRRDRHATSQLVDRGYRVLIAWECHINCSDQVSSGAVHFLMGGTDGTAGAIAETQRASRTGSLGIKRRKVI